MEEEKEIFRCDSCKRVVATFKPDGYFESTSGTRVSSNGVEWNFQCKCKGKIKVKLSPWKK